MTKLYYLLFIGLLLLIFPKNAHAYLDPGTGSYVLQIVSAFVIGALVSLKLKWQWIKAYFKRLTSKKEENSDTR